MRHECESAACHPLFEESVMSTFHYDRLFVGPVTRLPAKGAKIAIDFDSGDSDGIAIDIGPSPVSANNKAGIKLGDYTLMQDPSGAGTADFAVLAPDGTQALNLSASEKQAGSELYRITVPLIIAPTGSMGDNGVLTSGTVNPLVFLKTFTWFPTGAIFTASPAGWYYTVWTTTTAATVYQETWGGASVPTIPTTPTAWAVTGPGAFTGPTTNASYALLPMPAASVRSMFEVRMKFHQTNNANVKTVTGRMNTLSGTLLWTNTLTSFLENDSIHTLKLNGVADKQTVTGKTFGSTSYVRQAAALAAETTSAAWVLAVCASKATATDVIVIESVHVLHYR
jgi:hypothetical protein